MAASMTLLVTSCESGAKPTPTTTTRDAGEADLGQGHTIPPGFSRTVKWEAEDGIAYAVADWVVEDLDTVRDARSGRKLWADSRYIHPLGLRTVVVFRDVQVQGEGLEPDHNQTVASWKDALTGKTRATRTLSKPIDDDSTLTIRGTSFAAAGEVFDEEAHSQDMPRGASDAVLTSKSIITSLTDDDGTTRLLEAVTPERVLRVDEIGSNPRIQILDSAGEPLDRSDTCPTGDLGGYDDHVPLESPSKKWIVLGQAIVDIPHGKIICREDLDPANVRVTAVSDQGEIWGMTKSEDRAFRIPSPRAKPDVFRGAAAPRFVWSHGAVFTRYTREEYPANSGEFEWLPTSDLYLERK